MTGVQTCALPISGGSGDGTVTYYIDYTPSLLNAAWQTVESGTVTLDGTQSFLNEVGANPVIDPAKGFFRVRLAK